MSLTNQLRDCMEAGIPVSDQGRIRHHGYLRDTQSGAGNCVCGRHAGHDIHAMKIKDASAEQSKKTGGMIALYPRQADLENLVVNDPKAEPIGDLHCTVIFLGEDVSGQDPTELISQLDYVAGNYSPIEAQAFAHALFNPKGDEPCAVYLIGDNIDLVDLYNDLKRYVTDHYPGSKEQHPVFTPHITAGYGLPIEKLTYSGPVLFEKIGLRWPDHDQDWDL